MSKPNRFADSIIGSKRRLVVLVGVLVVGLLWSAAPAARADDLTDKRNKIRAEIAQTQREISSNRQNVASATQALITSRRQLAQAQAELEYIETELSNARYSARLAATKAAEAQRKLAVANAEVAAGERNVAAQKRLIGQAARTAYQQQTDLQGVGVILGSQSTADLSQRIQWNTTIFDSSSAQLTRLNALQEKLKAAKQRQALAKQQADADKAAADSLVVSTAALADQAAGQAAVVAALVVQNAASEKAAKADLAANEAEYKDLQGEDVKVTQRIAARIAAQKALAAKRAAEARAKAEAARKARLAAEAAARAKAADAAAKAEAARKAAAAAAAAARANGDDPAPSSAGGAAFVHPAEGPITSPFGMRTDPISGDSRFHSGTDFGADCGSPIRATRAGRVTERYYQSSYGNRMLIDHGLVNGDYITSAYNHASRYIVSVGERVSQGQVIGYIGTTGRSTGCHLHFMIYENGDLANPMRFL